MDIIDIMQSVLNKYWTNIIPMMPCWAQSFNERENLNEVEGH